MLGVADSYTNLLLQLGYQDIGINDELHDFFSP
jgi:hypothetical protein